MNTATLDRFNAPSSAVEALSTDLPDRGSTVELPNDSEKNLPGSSPLEVASKRHSHRVRLVIGLSLLVVGIAASAYYWVAVAPFESTDDAYVESDVTPIAPQVSGRVVRLLIADNQQVNTGDALLEIDPSDYETKLDQARANVTAAEGHIAETKAQFAVDRAKVEQEKAGVVAAAAEAARAQADLKRAQEVGPLGVSASELDLAATQARSLGAALDVARNRTRAVEAQMDLDAANVQTATADLQRAVAAVRQAGLDLSYTRIVAPAAGFVTHRAVQVGAYVQPGQPLLAIVPRAVWVVANFKETQLTHMRVGQPVEVTVDAYPQTTFKGHVDSIQAGAGARFSLLPPENASGNFVKVVQRVPVKIVLDGMSGTRQVLGPGMSVVPEVRVR